VEDSKRERGGVYTVSLKTDEIGAQKQTVYSKHLGGIPLRTIRNRESGERTPPAWPLELIAYRVEHDENFRK
jgi:hypothetical protein